MQIYNTIKMFYGVKYITVIKIRVCIHIYIILYNMVCKIMKLVKPIMPFIIANNLGTPTTDKASLVQTDLKKQTFILFFICAFCVPNVCGMCTLWYGDGHITSLYGLRVIIATTGRLETQWNLADRPFQPFHHLPSGGSTDTSMILILPGVGLWRIQDKGGARLLSVETGHCSPIIDRGFAGHTTGAYKHACS